MAAVDQTSRRRIGWHLYIGKYELFYESGGSKKNINFAINTGISYVYSFHLSRRSLFFAKCLLFQLLASNDPIRIMFLVLFSALRVIALYA